MRIAIIAITTNNSISVKAKRRRRMGTSLDDLGMKAENGTAAVRRAPTRVVRRNLRGKSKHLILELPRTTCQAELNRSLHCYREWWSERLRGPLVAPGAQSE